MCVFVFCTAGCDVVSGSFHTEGKGYRHTILNMGATAGCSINHSSCVTKIYSYTLHQRHFPSQANRPLDKDRCHTCNTELFLSGRKSLYLQRYANVPRPRHGVHEAIVLEYLFIRDACKFPYKLIHGEVEGSSQTGGLVCLFCLVFTPEP